MPSFRFHLRTTTAALALISAAASADTTAAPEPTESVIPEILVQATKRLEKLHDVANSISVLDAKTLTERQIDDFNSLAGQIPSLSIQDDGDGRVKLVLRGLNGSGAGALVGIVVDDVVLSYGSGLTDGSITTANLDSYDMGSIETLKGPQGTLYGGSSEGGLIRFVTNPPKFNTFEGRAEAGVKGIDDGGFGWSTKATLNIPLVEDKAAFRVSGLYEHVPGYIDDVLTDRQNINKGDKYEFRAQLRLAPIDDLGIKFIVFRQRQSYGSEGLAENVGQYGGSPTGVVPLQDQFNVGNGGRFEDNTFYTARNDNVFSYGAAVVDYDFGFATLLSSTSFGELRARLTDDISSALAAPGLPYGAYLGAALYAGPPNNGAPISLQGDQVNNADKVNEELRLTSDPDTKLFGYGFDWQVGAYYTREAITFSQVYHAIDVKTGQELFVPEPAGGSNLPAVYQEYSIYANADFHFTDDVDLSIGGRRSDVKQRSQVINYPGFAGAGPGETLYNPVINTDEVHFTWAVAPRWKIDEDNLAYVRIATGYRPGGPILQIPHAPPGFPTDYGSDNTINYEVGLRSALFDKKLQLSVAAFHIDWHKVQVIGQFIDPENKLPYNIETNGGEAISQGFEWDIDYQVLPGLTAGLQGSYDDAHLTKNLPVFGGQNGDDLAFAPRWATTFNLDYKWDVADDYKAFAGTSIIYTGIRYTDFGLSPFETHVKLPGYVTMNAQVGLIKGDYELEIFVQNVTNDHAISSFASEGGSNFQGGSTFIQPRTFGARISAKF